MKYINELKEFLEKSPTAFHATDNISTRLKNEGFTQLFEGKRWELNKGGKYFLTRNNSSVVAFKIGKELNKYGFQIAASHSDSPTFKIKENAQLEIISSNYTQLNTEGYGGMLCATWFDKPLSIAGRVIVKEGEHFKTKLINIDRDLVLIPNMAIHINRAANDGVKYNKQVDMLPLFGGKKTTKDALLNIIAEELGVGTVDIYGSDLFLYNRMPASIWGANSEFISCGRIDNLECAFSSSSASRSALRLAVKYSRKTTACISRKTRRLISRDSPSRQRNSPTSTTCCPSCKTTTPPGSTRLSAASASPPASFSP